MIELRNISKSYRLHNHNRHTVLDNISYTFTEGVNTGILGLNGSGKSTLLKILCGASFPDRGTVIRRSSISWPVAFSGCIVGSMTGYQNLRFISRIYKSDFKKDKQFVEDFTELGDYLNEPVKTYSSGMKAKLAFALSMAIGFDFYLVDEAFSVGDSTFRQRSVDLFKQKAKEATLIIVSHSISNVRELCSKALVLNNSKLFEHSSLDDSIAHYQDICKLSDKIGA